MFGDVILTIYYELTIVDAMKEIDNVVRMIPSF